MAKLEMKFKGHQSFFIRKGWLGKGIRAVENNNAIFMPNSSKEAMDELGLGANQVAALRYWLEALRLVEKENKTHKVLPLCDVIKEHDPYTEEYGTLWALHYNLACNEALATSWYWLFNESRAVTFTKADATSGIRNYALGKASAENGGKKLALSSVESDVDCIINTYIPHERLGGKPVSPENVIDCPLGDLGILDIDSRQLKTYRKVPTTAASLPSQLVMYAMASQAKKNGNEEVWGNGSVELTFEELQNGKCSPGRVFNLDSAALLSELYELEGEGLLKVNRTAGSDVVRLTQAGKAPEDYLRDYYETIG